MRHLWAILIFLLVLLPSLPGVGVADQSGQPNTSVLEEFNVFDDGDLLLVPVKIQSKSYLFALDTGCSATVIDMALAQGSLIDEQEMLGADGKVSRKVKRYKAPAMHVGKIPWEPAEPVIGEDLAPLRDVSGHDLYGLLGMDFLRNYAVRINFNRGKMFLLRSPVQAAGTRLPMFSLNAMPCVVGDISDWGPELFQIDTGAAGLGGLRKDLFRALARKGLLQSLSESKSSSLLGTERTYGGFLDRFTLEDTQLSSMALIESPFPYSFLGQHFWRRYNLTLDFPRQTIHLERSRWFGESDLFNSSGMDLNREKDTCTVEKVLEGSPAAQAGLKPGDVLLKIGDKHAAATRWLELMKPLSPQRSQVRIVFRRGDTRHEVCLLLKPWDRQELRPAFLREEPTKEIRALLAVQRGLAFSLKQNLDRAIADFDEALAADPDCLSALCCRSQAWAKKQDFGRALTDVDDAIRLRPKEVGSYLVRAALHQARQDRKKALDDFQEILRLDPKNLIAWKQASQIHALEGDLPRAMASIDEALRLYPKDAEAFALRGNHFRLMKKNDEALSEYNKAIALDPRCGLAFISRGAVRIERGEDHGALADLDEALKLGQANVLVYRALIWQRRKEFEKAIGDLEQTLRQDPENVMALSSLSWNLATCPRDNIRDGRKALVYAKKACALSRNSGLLEAVAAAHAECGEFGEAVRCQSEAIQAYALYPQFAEPARARLRLYETGQPYRENP